MAKLVSKTYGEALYEAAQEAGEGKAVELMEEIRCVSQVLEQNPQFDGLMKHPGIPKQEKLQIMENVFKGHVSDELAGLLEVVVSKERYKDLPAIFEYFTQRVMEQQRIGVGYVTTAAPLDPARRAAVEGRLLETAGYRSMELHYEVDPSIKMIVAAEDVVVQNGYVAEARFGLPQGAALSTHILKPQLTGKYPGLIEAEAWAMSVASAAARCAETALLRRENAPLTLVVRRFDRAITPEGTIRLHQEDCCQALGLPPASKYASVARSPGSDPSYRGIAQRLTAYAAESQRELGELLRQLVVNLALGNVDAHAKNHAFLYREVCSPELSPLYDVVPVRDIEPEARHLSLRVNGKVLADDVAREDVVAEAISWGLAASEAGAILDETLASLEGGLARASGLYPSAADRLEAPARRRIALLS